MKSFPCFRSFAFLVLFLTLGLEAFAQTEPAVSTSQEPPKSSYSRKYGANIGIQAPTGLVLELNYRPSPRFSFGVSGGGIKFDLPYDTGSSTVSNSVSIMAFEGKTRWHVSQGAFFLGRNNPIPAK